MNHRDLDYQFTDGADDGEENIFNLIKQSSSTPDPSSHEPAAQNNESFSNIPAFQRGNQ
jgi:hypothetical protein